MNTFNKLDLSGSHSAMKFFAGDLSKKKTGAELGFSVPEKDNYGLIEERYSQLKKTYDERIGSLHNSIRLIAAKFENDEILNTMKNESLEKEWVHQRMKEIIDDTLIKEKEDVIKKLAEEIADLKAKMAQKENYINDLKTRHMKESDEFEKRLQNLQDYVSSENQNNKMLEGKIKSLQSELENQDQQLKNSSNEYISQSSKIMNEYNRLKKDYENALEHIRRYSEIDKENDHLKREVDRLSKVVKVIELESKNNEFDVNDKNKKIEALHQELNEMKNQVFDFNLQIKKLGEENRNLNSYIDKYELERKMIFDKSKLMVEEAEKNWQNKVSQIEQMFKDKIYLLKKKIVEQKSNINHLNDQITKERENTEIQRNNLNQKEKEFLEQKLQIKNEWEKRSNEQEIYCGKIIKVLEDRIKEQQSEYEKIIAENENKKNNEMNEVANSYQAVIDEKDREITRLNNETELLKKIENDYIRISKHEEIMNFHLKELEQKHLDELNNRVDELQNEFSQREEDKRTEFDQQIESLKNEIVSLNEQIEGKAKEVEDLRKFKLEVDQKLQKEKENCERLMSNYEEVQKNLKFQNKQIEDDDKIIVSLREKINILEHDLTVYYSSKTSFQETLENLMTRVKTLENEKALLKNNLAKREEYFSGEIQTAENNLKETKESLTRKNSQLTEELNIKKQLIESYEINSKKMQNQISGSDAKCRDLSNQIEIFQQIINNMKQKIKSYEELLEEMEKKTFYSEKTLKKTKFEKSNTNDLLVKILKTKLQAMREQIQSMKTLMNNEMKYMKNDFLKRTSDALSQQLLSYKINYDKDLQIARENLQREWQKKLDEKDSYYNDELAKLTQKYDKKIMDLFKQNELLDGESNKLKEELYSYPAKFNEIEKENVRLQNIISNLKKENETLYNSVRHKKYEDFTNYAELLSKKDLSKKNLSSLQAVLNMVSKMKSKYLEEITALRNEFSGVESHYENEIKNNSNYYLAQIEGLEKIINEERQEMERFKNAVQNKDSEFHDIYKDIEKLKTMYESKVELLNNKIKELKFELKSKNEKLSESANLTNYNNNLIKSLKAQLDVKAEEIETMKKDYETLLDLKNRKILEINSIFRTKSSSSTKYSTKIDDDIKFLMKKLNLSNSDMPVNDK